MHPSASKKNKALLSSIFLLYALLRLEIFNQLPHESYILAHDAAQYMLYAHCSLFSACLYFNRPFFFPLFIKAWHYHYLTIAFMQCLISILAWGFVAYSTANVMQSKLIKIICFSFILIYSASAYLVLWDTKLLSESLSISLLMLFIGCYLQAMKTKFASRYLIGLIVTGFLMVNVRDANVYIIVACATGTILASLINRLNFPRKPALILLIATLLIFCFNAWTVNQGQRWLEPMSDLMANRVIDNPTMTQYFLSHGMPDITQQLKAVIGTFGGYNVIIHNPNPSVEPWFLLHSKQVYASYLASHPLTILSLYLQPQFWNDLLFAPALLRGYSLYGLHIPLPILNLEATIQEYSSALADSINSNCLGCIVALLTIGLRAYAHEFKYACKDKFIILAEITFIMSILLLASLVWLSEPMENMRHQLNNHLLIVMSIILFSFKNLDYIAIKYLKPKPN